ncbi:hypothetical protein BpHYR1_033384 [Brachionus plicatilis]|uniref:Uncharacterized protein n=1 Tax=Brachionus plicatilis TaxID=10195 RepID=A0A3M7PA91_BRAPC|nr:hypothetical protein BpHYR1_033384 [Brachionus plicatilis]
MLEGCAMSCIYKDWQRLNCRHPWNVLDLFTMSCIWAAKLAVTAALADSWAGVGLAWLETISGGVMALPTLSKFPPNWRKQVALVKKNSKNNLHLLMSILFLPHIKASFISIKSSQLSDNNLFSHAIKKLHLLVLSSLYIPDQIAVSNSSKCFEDTLHVLLAQLRMNRGHIDSVMVLGVFGHLVNDGLSLRHVAGPADLDIAAA